MMNRATAARPLTPRRATGALAVLALAASLAACGAATPEGTLRAHGVEVRTVALTDAPQVTDAVSAARSLGIATLALTGEEENVVLSPASLAMALGMLAEGARGESLVELEAVLGVAGDARSDAFAAIRGALGALEGDPAEAAGEDLPERPILHQASQVVIDDGFEVHSVFLEGLARTFDAGAQHTDLSTAEGLAPLHAWVREHTGGLIEESAIKPHGLLRVVLQDAITLAARWETPFGPAVDQPFTRADGGVVQVPTMSAMEVEYAHAEVDGWGGVRLPYTEALHADVLLPPIGVDPADATPELLSELTAALDAAQPGPIHLTLPTLDLESKTDLHPLLPDLGLGTLPDCGGHADLSGIAGVPGDLCVAQAVQQALLKVDEAGTVAAAVTELGIHAVSAPRIEAAYLFDRPFLFTVSHDETGWPLFLAAIRDPRH